MKKRIELYGKNVLLAVFMIVSMMFAGCSDEVFVNDEGKEQVIRFNVSTTQMENSTSGSRADNAGEKLNSVLASEGKVSDKPLYMHEEKMGYIDSHNGNEKKSRGTFITQDNFFSKIRVMGMDNNDNDLLGGWQAVSEISSWQSVTGWPKEAENMRFWAYAASEEAITNQIVQAESETNYYWYPSISYFPPENVDQQVDLLYAQSHLYRGHTYETVDLQFEHITSAIRFAVDQLPAGTVIEEVKLSNIKSSAWYNKGYEDREEAYQGWTANGWTEGGVYHQNLKDYTITPNYTVQANEANNFIDGGKIMFMIPQQLRDDAKITVRLRTVGGEEKVVSTSLRGKAWPKGYTMTYKLSSSAITTTYTLTVDPTTAYIGVHGDDFYFKVYSYSTSYENAGRTEQPYTIDYSVDDGNTWTSVTNIVGSDYGSPATGETRGVRIAPQERILGGSHAAIMRSRNYLTRYGGAWDLSSEDYDAPGKWTEGQNHSWTTANCYVIYNPGHFCFPMVYGNALYKGNVNQSAYVPKATGAGLVSNFYNYRGNSITNPGIKNDIEVDHNYGVKIKYAKLIWEDHQGLVTDVAITADSSYIEFKSPQATIQPGNAVIGLFDSNDKCVWSWHLWFTDEDVYKTTRVENQLGSLDFMNFNLGWFTVDDTFDYWKERDIIFKITQTASGKEARTVVHQLRSEIGQAGYNTYYQWGRKDPMPTAYGLFPAYGYPFEEHENASANLRNQGLRRGIIYPNFMFKGDKRDWVSETEHYSNLWNGAATGDETSVSNTKVQKTIYDPCPRGFVMPPSAAFTGMTLGGIQTADKTQWNVVFNIVTQNSYGFYNGWFMYVRKMPSAGDTDALQMGQTYIYLPATGYRSPYNSDGSDSYDISVKNNNIEGSYWTAGPYIYHNSLYRGYGLWFKYAGEQDKSIWPAANDYHSERAVARSVRPVKE